MLCGTTRASGGLESVKVFPCKETFMAWRVSWLASTGCLFLLGFSTASAPAAPSVATTCDASASRAVLAAISYRLHRTGLDSTRLEFSDTGDGFQTGRLVSVHVRRGKSGQLIRRDGRYLRAELVGGSIDGDSVFVRLKSLEPGLAYRWRVVELGNQGSIAGEVAQTTAVTCQ